MRLSFPPLPLSSPFPTPSLLFSLIHPRLSFLSTPLFLSYHSSLSAFLKNLNLLWLFVPVLLVYDLKVRRTATKVTNRLSRVNWRHERSRVFFLK